MTRSKLNERLVVFSRGKSGVEGLPLEVAVRPSEVVEVMPDLRYGYGADWTRIVMRNKSEHSVNHPFSLVISLLNRLTPIDDMKDE